MQVIFVSWLKTEVFVLTTTSDGNEVRGQPKESKWLRVAFAHLTQCLPRPAVVESMPYALHIEL